MADRPLWRIQRPRFPQRVSIMGFRLSVTATRDDWLSAFGDTSDALPVRFHLLEMHPSETIPSFTLAQIPGLGEATHGILTLETACLATPTERLVNPYGVERNDGSVVYYVNQVSCPDSFVFRPGGAFRDDYFVVGEISSLYDQGIAPKFAQKVMQRIRRKFHRAPHFWLGAECFNRHAETGVFTDDYRTVKYPIH